MQALISIYEKLVEGGVHSVMTQLKILLSQLLPQTQPYRQRYSNLSTIIMYMIRMYNMNSMSVDPVKHI